MWHVPNVGRRSMVIEECPRFGSKADIAVHSCDVRITPKSGHRRARSPCPLCARSKTPTSDPDAWCPLLSVTALITRHIASSRSAPDRVRTHFRSPVCRRCTDRYKERAMPRATCRVDLSDRACRVGVGALRSGSAGHWTSAVSSDGSVSGSKADGSGTGSVLWSAA